MIAFDLKCQASHVFEAWFGTSSDYETQKERGLLTCPICGDQEITKAIMAPNVARKANQSAPAKTELPAEPQTPAAVPSAPAAKAPQVMPSPALPKEATEKLMTAISEIRKEVEKNCDYVGDEFAEEARKIHYGEADERGIYGETTLEEAEELFEEGIEIAPLPFGRKSDQFDA